MSLSSIPPGVGVPSDERRRGGNPDAASVGMGRELVFADRPKLLWLMQRRRMRAGANHKVRPRYHSQKFFEFLTQGSAFAIRKSEAGHDITV